MRTHKRSENPRKTLCDLNITYGAPDLTEPTTDDPKKTTCPDCLEAMGEANSKQQTMTAETLKVKTGDQWEDDFKNRYIITCFATGIEFYFFLISKETGRIVGRLDVFRNRYTYGVPEGQNPPEPLYNQAARKALNITEDMVFVYNPVDGHIGEDRWDKQKGKVFEETPLGHCEPLSSDLYPEKGSGTYEHLKIQPWYFIEANQLSFLEGSVIKRLCRHRVKDGVKDIDKAIDELQKLKEYHYKQ